MVERAVDAYSLQCLECHSDSADFGPIAMNGAGLARHGGTAGNHPVGKDYRRWIDYGGYRPVAQIPEPIRLPDGKVSCVSCHEAYRKEHGALVMPNDKSQICFGCHNL